MLKFNITLGILLISILSYSQITTIPSGGSGGAPSGAAGGVLSGTYPNPGFATAPTFTGTTSVVNLHASAEVNAIYYKDAAGTIGQINTGFAGTAFLLQNTSATNIPFQVLGATSQSADLQRWADVNAAIVYAKVSAAGAITALAYQGSGTIPAISACGTIVAGSTNSAGRITTATGACAPVITFTFTATTDWSCSTANLTTPANIFVQTNAASTTTATLTGVSAANDVVRYQCTAY